MRKPQMLKLELEEFEERIAPGLPVLTTGLLSPEGTNTVVGPGAAVGGVTTAEAAVTGAGVEIDNLEIEFVC